MKKDKCIHCKEEATRAHANDFSGKIEDLCEYHYSFFHLIGADATQIKNKEKREEIENKQKESFKQ